IGILLDGPIESHGLLVDFGLHLQHALATQLQCRQEPFLLLLAELPQYFLQLFLGLLQFFNGLVLLGAGFFLLVLGDLLFGLLLVLIGFVHLLLARSPLGGLAALVPRFAG